MADRPGTKAEGVAAAARIAAICRRYKLDWNGTVANEAPKPKPQPKPRAAPIYTDWERVDAIWQQGVGLTDWESEFLESIERRLRGRWELTPRQAAVLERIYIRTVRDASEQAYYAKYVHEDWVEAIMHSDASLSDWEQEFVESIERQLKQDRPLSQKQEAILERIYRENV